MCDLPRTDANVIFSAVLGVPQDNIALNKTTWSTENNTEYPSSWAVDGIVDTFAYVSTDGTFVAVDLGARFYLKKIVVNLFYGECLIG